MKLIEPRLLKGFRDYLPVHEKARVKALDQIRKTFELFGFEPLQTPTLEYADILAGKYGEEGELSMYRFTDNGEREVAMRYDLTVPLARVVAQYQQDLPRPFKRYQIAPVWRTENTQKGRYREFLQCDADIVGADIGIADAECIALVEQVMHSLSIPKFITKVSNRKILNAIMHTAHVPAEKILDAIRAIDKIDKVGANGVREELEEKIGMKPHEAEGLIRLASTKVPDIGTLKTFMNEYILKEEQGKQGFAELNSVFTALKELGVQNVEIDLSLARGLDYYTSTIFETIITTTPDSRRFGSIAGGGRYDRLLALFTGKDIPSVGASIGIDRLFSAMEELGMTNITNIVKVLVLNIDAKYEPEYLQLLRTLRTAGIASEMVYKQTDLKKQFAYAESKSIPYGIIIGEDEMKKGHATIRNLQTRKQNTVPLSEVVQNLSEK